MDMRPPESGCSSKLFEGAPTADDRPDLNWRIFKGIGGSKRWRQFQMKREKRTQCKVGVHQRDGCRLLSMAEQVNYESFGAETGRVRAADLQTGRAKATSHLRTFKVQRAKGWRPPVSCCSPRNDQHVKCASCVTSVHRRHESFPMTRQLQMAN